MNNALKLPSQNRINNTIGILIIEDDAAVADYLKETLTGTRETLFSCSVAEDLSSGLALLKESRFDVVLLDLGLPDSQGIDTAVTVRQHFPDIPIVVLTGLTDEDIAINALRMDVQDYLIKGQLTGALLVRSLRYAIERKRAHEALRESEEKFRAFFESVAVGTAQLDPLSRRFAEVNDRFCQITGRDCIDLLAMTFEEITHPDDRKRSRELFEGLISGSFNEYNLEKRFLRKDGSTVWVQVAVTLIRDSAGRPARTLEIIQDITGRKQAEEALRKSEALLKETQDISKVGGWELDVKSGRVVWTDEVYHIYGVSRDFDPNDIPASMAFYDPESLPLLQDAFRKAVGNGEPYDLELKFTNAQGRHIWVRTIGRPVRSNGAVIRLSGNIIDITDRKLIAENLRESEERLRLAAYAANFGTYDINIQNGEVFWSPELKGLFGLPPEAASKIPLTEGLKFAHPDDRERISQVLSASMDPAGSDTFNVEHRIIRTDGSVIWVNMRGRTFFEGEGAQRRPVRITGVLMDITERKRAEEELRKSEERLRMVVEAARALIYEVDVRENRIVVLRGLKEVLGYEPSEIAYSRGWWNTILHPDDRAAVDAHVNETKKTGRDYSVEYRVRHKWGDYITVQDTGKAIRDSAGRVTGFVGGVVDITERRQAEEELRVSEERFREVFAHAPVGMVVLDPQGRYLYVNRSFSHITGYAEQELAKSDSDFKKLTHPDDLGETIQGVKKLFSGEMPVFFQEKRYIRKDGSIVWVRMSASVRRNHEGRPFQIMALVEDIDERKRAEAALRESEARFRTLADNIAQHAWMADEKGWVFWYNKRWFDYTGMTPEEMRGRGSKNVQHPDHVDRVVKSFMSALKKGEAWEDTFPLRGKDGAYRWFLSRAIPIRSEQGKVERWFGTNTDITDRMRMEEEIKHIAQHDPLTGLPNRRLLNEIITMEMAQARRSGRRVAIFFLDLDRFKEINDTLGHETGDGLLMETATRLRAVIRTSDTVARIGGDEFNVLIPDISYPEYASEVAQKILNEIRRPFRVNGHELNVSTSIGISVFPDDGADIDTLLRYADIAMYYAKEHGRNMYQFYNPVINTRSLERMRFENSLRRALDQNEFRLFFQPLVDVETGKIVSAEVLLRWQHPERGLLEPAEFFNAAEEIGFMLQIDEWVLRSACSRIKSWIDDGILPVCVTVNLSVRQFQSPDLPERLAGMLRETGMPADCLDIEITETAAMGNVEYTLMRLKELAGIGVNVSIDNFGMGYSSLNQLRRLPIRKLKIDKSFIRDIPTDSDDRAIISAVLLMAHSMKMKVVATGVEVDNQLSFLREAHCDQAQGFLFSEPVPVEEFSEMVKAGK